MNIQQLDSEAKVNAVLLERFLAPYKTDCRYLKKAWFQHSVRGGRETGTMRAEFAIPESCYIDDTGHFNSVEFNICYNQLFYITIAYLLQNQAIAEMSDWDLDIYQRRQLSDFLIVKFSSTFKQPINSDAFQGELSIYKCAKRGNLIVLKTSCCFYDRQGRAEGDVTIAILNPEAEKPADRQISRSA